MMAIPTSSTHPTQESVTDSNSTQSSPSEMTLPSRDFWTRLDKTVDLGQTEQARKMISQALEVWTLFEETVYLGQTEQTGEMISQASDIFELIPTLKRIETIVTVLLKTRQNAVLKKLTSLSSFPEMDSTGRTALLWAKIYKNQPMVKYFRKEANITSYWNKNSLFYRRKIIINLSGKRALTKFKNKSSGISRFQLYPVIGDLVHQFIQSDKLWPFPKSWGHGIENAIIQTLHPEQNSKKLVEEIQKQSHPIIIETGTSQHSINVVFHKNMVFICNRGETLDPQNRHLIIGHFDPSHPKLETIIDTLLKIDSEISETDSLKYIYQEFFKELQAIEDIPLEKKIRKYCPLSNQKGNNCVQTSLKTAILACLLSYQLPKNSDRIVQSKIFESSWKTYKAFSQFSRNFGLSLIK